MTTTNAEIGAYLNSLTEDTTPDRAADFVMTYDASASAVKKVKPNNLVAAYPSGAAVAVQSKGNEANAASVVVTLDAGPTNGNFIILGVGGNPAVNVQSVGSTNTEWRPVISYGGVAIWVGKVSGSAGAAITVTMSGSNYVGARALEVSGLNARVLHAASGEASGPAGAATPAPYVATGDLLFYIERELDGSTSLTATTGMTLIGTANYVLGVYCVGQPSGWAVGSSTATAGMANRIQWAVAVLN